MAWIEGLNFGDACAGVMRGRPARNGPVRFCNLPPMARCVRCGKQTCYIHGRPVDGRFTCYSCRPQIVLDLTGPGVVEEVDDD